MNTVWVVRNAETLEIVFGRTTLETAHAVAASLNFKTMICWEG